MLLRCSLMHITTIIPRNILCLVYLCPCPSLGLFMPYLCDLFFIFSFIFIVINRITRFKQTYLFFVGFLEYLLLFLDDNLDEKREYPTNASRGFHVEMTWKRPFPSRFSVESTWCVCRVVFKDIRNPYNCLLKSANFSIKASNE